MLVVYFLPQNLTFFHYCVVLGLILLNSFASNMMFVSQGTFFAKISDTSIGGTHLTLLNTITNLGGTWPKFFVLWFVDVLTIRNCQDNTTTNCEIVRDGYFLIGAFCFLYGIVWYLTCSNRVIKLEKKPAYTWKIVDQ